MRQLDKCVVATDDQRIFDAVRSFGGEVIMTDINCENGTVIHPKTEYHVLQLSFGYSATRIELTSYQMTRVCN